MESCITDEEDRRVTGLYLRLITCFKLSITKVLLPAAGLSNVTPSAVFHPPLHSVLSSTICLERMHENFHLLRQSKVLYVSQVVYAGRPSNWSVYKADPYA
jgi:hypothetical protein